MSSTKDTKLLVIGFDSADWFLMNELMEAGELPTFSALAENGVFCPLNSTTPYQSGPAWTAFATGANPCKSGVFSFGMPPENYIQRPAFSNDIPYPAFWEILGNMDFRCGVANIPMVSFPPRAFNGFIVSGYPAPDESSAYPEKVHSDFFNDTSMKIPIPAGYPQLAEYIQHTIFSDLRRASAMPGLVRSKPVDGLVVMFDMLDRVQHYYWHDYDPSHPAHDPDAPGEIKNIIPESYKTADSITSFLLNEFDAWETCIIISDHGSKPMAWRFNLFRLLLTNGLITLKEQSDVNGAVAAGAKNLAPLLQLDKCIVYPVHETLSTAVGLNVNIAGREPAGTVPPSRAGELIDEITGLLKKQRNPLTGEYVFEEVYRKEELCYAEFYHNCPDILAMSNHKIVTVPMFADEVLAIQPPPPAHHRTSFQITGMHRREGILLAAGKYIDTNAKIEPAPSIADIPPTLLASCGIDKTPGMDGARLPIFKSGALPAQLAPPSLILKCDNPSGACTHEISELDRKAAIERLEGMGYI